MRSRPAKHRSHAPARCTGPLPASPPSFTALLCHKRCQTTKRCDGSRSVDPISHSNFDPTGARFRAPLYITQLVDFGVEFRIPPPERLWRSSFSAVQLPWYCGDHSGRCQRKRTAFWPHPLYVYAAGNWSHPEGGFSTWYRARYTGNRFALAGALSNYFQFLLVAETVQRRARRGRALARRVLRGRDLREYPPPSSRFLCVCCYLALLDVRSARSNDCAMFNEKRSAPEGERAAQSHLAHTSLLQNAAASCILVFGPAEANSWLRMGDVGAALTGAIFRGTRQDRGMLSQSWQYFPTECPPGACSGRQACA